MVGFVPGRVSRLGAVVLCTRRDRMHLVDALMQEMPSSFALPSSSVRAARGALMLMTTQGQLP